MLRFLAFGARFAKIHPGTFTRMNLGESCPQMLGNEALVPLTEAEMLGNEALRAVLDEMHRNTLNVDI